MAAIIRETFGNKETTQLFHLLFSIADFKINASSQLLVTETEILYARNTSLKKTE